MSFVINTNVNSLLAQNYLTDNQAKLSQALQRLSSGSRINNAADDPAGLAISTSMLNTSNSLRQGARNGNDGISLVQTAQSAMNDISNLLGQMTTLATQASTGTYSSTQLNNLDTQFGKLLSEIGRVAATTSFNGVNLLDGSTGSVSIQVGSNNTSNDRLSITLNNLTTGSSGLSISSLVLTSQSGAQSALSTLNGITAVTTGLATLGASETNLTAAVAVDNSIATSLDAAKSRIFDADFAAESSNQAKYNILTQASIAMLAQANAVPNMVMQLLKG
ncbi:MAG: flagellin [Gammaproteobacteria bacterium]